MPAARSRAAAGSKIVCALSRDARSWSQRAAASLAVPGLPRNRHSGTAVKSVTLAAALSASSIPASIAFSAPA
jgi:hypothetical protein